MVSKQTTMLVLLSVLLIGGGWLFNQRLTLLEQRWVLSSLQIRTMENVNHSLATQMSQVIPTGTVIGYAGPLNPSLRQQLQQNGWLVCDGSEYSIAEYPVLYQTIQSTYGVAADKTFKVPDFRGVFLRGLDSDKGYDPTRSLGSYQADVNKIHTHAGETALAGQHQHSATSEFAGKHQHLLEAKGYWYTSKQRNERPAITQEVDDNQKYWTTPEGEHRHEITVEASDDHRHSLSLAPQGEAESRPKNYPVIYLIKY